MRSIDDVLNELTAAKERGDVNECLELCREGARLSRSPTEEGWYAFRTNLATFLLSDGRRMTANDVEEAISVYSELTELLPNESPKKRGAALLGLGWAYYLRLEGETIDNLRMAVDAFTNALTYYTRESDPYTWASTKAALGLAYSEIDKAGVASALHESIRNYEDALLVLRRSEYPEDWNEINSKLELLLNARDRNRGG